MGADIYLRSFDEQIKAAAERAIAGSEDDPNAAIAAAYEAMAETGGYFRDPYNQTGLLTALGLDWSRDVGPMLNADRELPVEGAHHLFVEIKNRPVAPAMVEDVLAGRVFHHAFELLQQLGFEETRDLPSAPELEAHLSKRRARLMALLERSIALGEPLVCSI